MKRILLALAVLAAINSNAQDKAALKERHRQVVYDLSMVDTSVDVSIEIAEGRIFINAGTVKDTVFYTGKVDSLHSVYGRMVVPTFEEQFKKVEESNKKYSNLPFSMYPFSMVGVRVMPHFRGYKAPARGIYLDWKDSTLQQVK